MDDGRRTMDGGPWTMENGRLSIVHRLKYNFPIRLRKEPAMYDKKKLGELKQSLEKWEETSLHKALASMPERQNEFITTSSEPIEGLYTPLDVAERDYATDLGLPGEYPYTRGVHPTLYRSKLW